MQIKIDASGGVPKTGGSPCMTARPTQLVERSTAITECRMQNAECKKAETAKATKRSSFCLLHFAFCIQVVSFSNLPGDGQELSQLLDIGGLHQVMIEAGGRRLLAL